MYPLYKDLREALGTPLWIDQHGVPRYAPFHPSLQGIYDKWAAAFIVQCQACNKQFLCAAGCDPLMEAIKRHPRGQEWDDLAYQKAIEPMNVLGELLCWGDAPWHTQHGEDARFDGQCSGTTMCADIIRIVEVWRKVDMEWQPYELTTKQADELLGEDN